MDTATEIRPSEIDKPDNRGRHLFVMVAVVGILVLGFFLVRSLGDEVVFYLTPTEAVERYAEFDDGTRFRLGGLVEVGSVQAVGSVYNFRVTDGGNSISVQLSKTPPQMFAEDRTVLLDGYWDEQTFVSDLALVRHEEDYTEPTVVSPDS